MRRELSSKTSIVLAAQTRTAAISAMAIALSLFPTLATSHSLPKNDENVNSPSHEADSKNAKLTFLTSRAVHASVSSKSIEAAQSIYYSQFLWHQTHLTVCFWNGSEDDQREVMKAAASWTDAAPNLQFDFEANGHVRNCQISDLSNFSHMSNIRINLESGDPRPLWNSDDIANKKGDWAYPGPSVSQNPKYPITMSLANVLEYRQNSRTSEYLFTIRHEFGHALGLVHEHQRQACNGWFNITQIAHDTGWTPSFTKLQVDALPATSNTFRVIGGYDIQSIMQYNFEPSWYMPDKPGIPNPCRRRDDVYDLSESDRVVIDTLYQPELNNTAERAAFIRQARTVAAAAPPANPASPSQKSDIEAALEIFRQKIGSLEPISIQVFVHPQDKDVVLGTIQNLGYPLLDQLGKPIRSVAHATRGLEGFPTNAVLFTSDVSPEDVRYVALSLLRAGIDIRSIEPYSPSKNNGYARRKQLIQIGTDVDNRCRYRLMVEEVLTLPLPMYGGGTGPLCGRRPPQSDIGKGKFE